MMAHDIPMYYRYNVRHCHYMHVYTGSLGMKRLNNYLFAALLWDPAIDVETMVSEYYKIVYKDYAEDMSRLYEKLEYALSNIKQLKHYRSLAERIKNDQKPLFQTEHFQLTEYHPDINDGIDLIQSVTAIKECRKIMNAITAQILPDELAAIMAEDDKNLFYAENTILFFFYTAQSVEAKWASDLNRARDFYQMSLPYAVMLERETEIVQTSSSHANAENGLMATGCEEAYKKLGRELGFDFVGFKTFWEKRMR